MSGYAATEAMICLIMISLTVIYGLSAFQTAGGISQRALERRRATAVLNSLFRTSPETVGVTSGQIGKFHYVVNFETTGDAGPVFICRRRVALMTNQGAKVYSQSGALPCPAERNG